MNSFDFYDTVLPQTFLDSADYFIVENGCSKSDRRITEYATAHNLFRHPIETDGFVFTRSQLLDFWVTQIQPLEYNWPDKDGVELYNIVPIGANGKKLYR